MTVTSLGSNPGTPSPTSTHTAPTVPTPPHQQPTDIGGIALASATSDSSIVTSGRAIGFSLNSTGYPGATSMSGSAAESHNSSSASSTSVFSSNSACSSTSSAPSSASSHSKSSRKRPVATTLDFNKDASDQSKRKRTEQSKLDFTSSLGQPNGHTPTSSQLSPGRSIASEERARDIHSIDRNIDIDIEENGSLGSTTSAAEPTPAPIRIREETQLPAPTPPPPPPVPTLNGSSGGDTEVT